LTGVPFSCFAKKGGTGSQTLDYFDIWRQSQECRLFILDEI